MTGQCLIYITGQDFGETVVGFFSKHVFHFGGGHMVLHSGAIGLFDLRIAVFTLAASAVKPPDARPAYAQ